jgi:hypothetical protein
MNKLAFIFFVMIFPFILVAQENNEKENKEETLIKDMDMEIIGIFGGPIIKVTKINGEAGLMVGGRGGIIFDNTLSIGGGGYGLTSNHTILKTINSADETYTVDFGYGGLILEYVNNPYKLVHFSVRTLIGGGSLSTTKNDYLWGDKNYVYQSSSVFVFEPGIDLELNMHKYFKVTAGLSYRLVSGGNLDLIKNSDMSGFSGDLMFKFYLGDIIGTAKKIMKEIKEKEI